MKQTIIFLVIIALLISGCSWLNSPVPVEITGDRADAPQFSPASGLYQGTSVQVELSSGTPGAEIFYTLDGSNPTDYSIWQASMTELSNSISNSVECATIFYALNETIYNDTSSNNVGSWKYHIGGLVATGQLTQETIESCQAVMYVFDPTYSGDINALFYNTNAVSDCETVFNLLSGIMTEDFNSWFQMLGDFDNTTVQNCTGILSEWNQAVQNSQGSTLYTGPINISENTTIRAVSNKAGYLPSVLSSAQYSLDGYVPPANQQPLVYAGMDISIRLPSSASLAGVVQDDGLPVPPSQTTALWSKISGPGTVTFSSPTATQTSATFSSAGTYVLSLTGNDGALQSSDDVQVTVLAPEVTNLPPSIVITRPLNDKVFSYSRRLKVTIRVAASDPDGTISKIQYFANNQLIKETTSSSINWQNMQRGNYALVARAFDNKNATTNSTTVNVRIV